MKKLCVVTGSRAEYSLLKPVMLRILEDKECELLLIVAGMHLDTRYGITEQEIIKDGFSIQEKIEMNLATDTKTGICKSTGLGLLSFGDAYEGMKPDMVILLGDRYEILSAAVAACICNIPIAHIHGGEITKGSIDDCMRHAITKMSYLHFTCANEYQRRVIQLGEDPKRVYQVGALGIENITRLSLLSREELETCLAITLHEPYLVVTYHPMTLDEKETKYQIKELLLALDSFVDYQIIFTRSNSDAGGDIINKKIDTYILKNKARAMVFSSLGSLRYFSLVKYAKAVIGNSSSGILEVPYLRIPVVNIGERQEGRIKPDFVINSKPTAKEIARGIHHAITHDWKNEKGDNPYYKENTSKNIINIIKQNLNQGIQLKKGFYQLKQEKD